MAIFRKLHTSFWSDPFIQDLNNEQKLFYLYLLTNEKTKQCGIYEISKKQICFDLGYSIENVTKLINHFVKIGKIMYSEKTNEIAIKNWLKFNNSTSPKVVSCIQSELKQVKDRVLIEYTNGIYTPSQEEKEQEEEEEQEQQQEKDLVLQPIEPTIEQIFEWFWNAYQKVGVKKTSLTAFKKLSKNEMLLIKEHLPKYLDNHHRNGKMQFLPHFSTYINQRRWENKLPYENSQEKTNNWGV